MSPAVLLTSVGVWLLVIAFAFNLLECVLYFGGFKWYYRLGPCFHREEWQTSASISEAYEAIARHLPRRALRCYQWHDGFGFRRKWWHAGAYPRSVLRVLEGANGAILCCEVRPFISSALLALSLIGLLVFPVSHQFGYFVFVAFMELMTIAIYVGPWKWELRLLTRLGHLRNKLQEIGVRVCDHCSYDLHGRDALQPCPECGRVAEIREAPPLQTVGNPQANGESATE